MGSSLIAKETSVCLFAFQPCITFNHQPNSTYAIDDPATRSPRLQTMAVLPCGCKSHKGSALHSHFRRGLNATDDGALIAGVTGIGIFDICLVISLLLFWISWRRNKTREEAAPAHISATSTTLLPIPEPDLNSDELSIAPNHLPYVGDPPKQLTSEQILGIDKRSLLQDLPAYEGACLGDNRDQMSIPWTNCISAGQSPFLTVNPTVINSSGDGKSQTREPNGLQLYVNPRDVEKGPNPVLEAHILKALENQGETSCSSQHPIYGLTASEVALSNWQDANSMPVSKAASISKGKKPIKANASRCLGEFEDMDVYLPPLGDLGNFCWQGSEWHSSDLEPNVLPTRSESDSRHSVSTEATPHSLSSTPASSDPPESCSCSMVSERVYGASKSDPDKPTIKSVVGSPCVILHPAMLGYEDLVARTCYRSSSAVNSAESSPTMVGIETASNTSSPLTSVPTQSSATTATSTSTTATVDSARAVDLPFACTKCPCKFRTAGQMS